MKADPLATKNYLMGKIDEWVKQAGRDTMGANVDADPYSVGYARIPDGESCDFCRMLGSRGFIYHSQESAGGGTMHGTEFDSYHPWCNCQIAVSFDRAVLDYWRGRTHVTRAFADDGVVVAPARDGSDTLREYDPHALFEEYERIGKSYTSNNRSTSGGTKLTQKKLVELIDLIDNAETLDDLMQADKRIMSFLNRLTDQRGRSNQYKLLAGKARRKKEELEALA